MTVVMTRRDLIRGLAAGTVVALSGCAYNQDLGRSQLMLVSDQQLAKLGADTWKGIVRQEGLSRDQGLQRRLETVGARCVQAAGLGHLDWDFAVLDNKQINAFALPGGKVGFFSGIFDVMANDDQVATVMGHEIGHVAARHSAERYSQQVAAGLLVNMASVALTGTNSRQAAEIAAVLGAGVSFGVILPFSRQHEYEADALGVRYMTRGGYNPNEAVAFWQKMTAKNRSKPLEFMSTHPSDENRIAAIQQQIATLKA